MKKIKVAYFIDIYRPGAGTENQLKFILQNQDPERVEAKLFTLRETIDNKYLSEIPCPTECLYVKSLFSPDGIIKFFNLVRRLRSEKFDIAMIYFVDSNLFVAPACRLAGLNNIVVNRRDLGYWYGERNMRLLNRINRLTDYFLVNSYAVKKVVTLSEKFPADRIKVIYNALREKESNKPDDISREKLNIPPDARIVGIVANLRPVKRIDRFLQVAAKVRSKINNSFFLVLGGGELEWELKELSISLGLKDQISFLGQVSNVSSYLSLFEVGVLTSESEGLSNTLMEYLQADVPSVAFNVGGNNEIIKNEVNGFTVPDGNIEKMANCITEILNNSNLAEKFSAAGKEMVENQFQPANMINQLHSFYKTIVSLKKRKARFD
jgi:L-malate glycosyltransferase